MLVGFKANNHPQQKTKPLVDDRALPPSEFAILNERFNFSIDVAASHENHKCARYITAEQDALWQSWSNERVYCNPPYSEIWSWINKAWNERQTELIVMLLPANRTEQGWWQKFIEPYRDKSGSCLTTEFVKGRTRFLKPGVSEIGPNERPPFGCVLCIWNRSMETLQPPTVKASQ